VQAYFAEVSVQAISLRTDGIVRTVTSWDLLQDKFTLSANQLIEIKLASYSFKCDANRKYDQTVERNTVAEFSQYIDYEGTRIASLQRPFNSQTTRIAARDSS
jgi:hypothetical protein